MKNIVFKLEPNPNIKKLFYHITELAYMTGLSIRALKGRRERGQIKMINEGNEILIEAKEVDRFISSLNNHL